MICIFTLFLPGTNTYGILYVIKPQIQVNIKGFLTFPVRTGCEVYHEVCRGINHRITDLFYFTLWVVMWYRMT